MLKDMAAAIKCKKKKKIKKKDKGRVCNNLCHGNVQLGECTGAQLVVHKVGTNQFNQSNQSNDCLGVNSHVVCGPKR